MLKSSCSNCSDVTKKFEEYCLRKMFGLFRAQIKLQSNRHKKKVRFHVLGPTGYKKEIDPQDAPSVLLFPLLSAPSILNTDYAHKLPLIVKGHKRIDIAKGRLVHSGSLILNYHYDLIMFARMLAKIAHSFAVAELGEENLSPLLLDIILDRDCSLIGSLIGQSENSGFRNFGLPSLHHIGLQFSDDKSAPMTQKWVVVQIQLFKPWSDVTYTVVAGRATATRSILKWKGLSRLTTSELESFRQEYGIVSSPQDTMPR